MSGVWAGLDTARALIAVDASWKYNVYRGALSELIKFFYILDLKGGKVESIMNSDNIIFNNYLELLTLLNIER